MLDTKDPDAWDTSVADSGVDIDIHTELSDTHFGDAWMRWRRQWQERTALNDYQRAQKNETNSV